MRKENRENLIKLNKHLKGFRNADLIIQYLSDPDNPDNKLSKDLKESYERYVLIHGLRMRYKQHSYIINYLKDQYGRTERQSRHDIAECEYIFGKVIRVDRAFEIAFLIEMSRKNIEMAMLSKNTKNITMALKQHFDILGPSSDESLLPDFSNFEPHKYSIVLPKGLPEQLLDMIGSGAINLSEVIPSTMLKIAQSKDIEDAQDLNNA